MVFIADAVSNSFELTWELDALGIVKPGLL